MNTKHFKDSENNTFGLDTTSGNWESFIGKDWVEISKEEAELLANPPPTQQEIDQKKSSENVAFLTSETERIEAEIKIYERMRDRNRADTDDLAMLELLEDYSIDLKKVTKQKGWPLEVEWPIAPEF